MGTVYRAQHTRLEKLVALKVLSGNMKHIDEYVERFHREALLAAKLEHPNVVRIYDYGQENDVLYPRHAVRRGREPR
jgi:serine/threonine protein kinase